MKWNDTKKRLPLPREKVLIWLITGEIVSAELRDDRTESYWSADLEDFDGHDEFYMDMVKAWSPFPHKDEIS